MCGEIWTYRNINQRYARAIIRVRVVPVDKSMLAPVPDHEAQTEQRQRQHNSKGTGPWVESEERHDHGIAGQLPKSSLECKCTSAFSQKIERKIEPDEEVESPDVVKEVKDVVAFVA